MHVPEQRTLHRLRPLQHSLALASEDPFWIASHSGLPSCSPLALPASFALLDIFGRAFATASSSSGFSVVVSRRCNYLGRF